MNKPKFTTRYTALIKKAAAIAKYEGKSIIERHHLMLALQKMAPKLFNRLLGCKQLMFVGEVPFNEVGVVEPCSIAFSSEAYRVLSLFGGYLGKVVEDADAHVIDLAHVAVALILDDSADSPVRELLSANGLAVDKVSVMDALKRITRNNKKDTDRQIYRAVVNIRKRMLAEVVGQEAAISKICDSLLGNWLIPPGERVTPVVFTIVAKSGYGKTLVANTLSDAIVRNRGGSITVLNGGLFATDQNAQEIIGYSSGWKRASIGAYTGPVIDDPNAIIIIENFDLLHPISRSHIMKSITTGSLKDDMLGRDVSFRNATIILLSAAGCDGAYFDDANADKTRTRLVEELTCGMSDQNRRDNLSALSGVSTELVMLRELTVQELRQVFIRTIEAEISSIKKSIAKKVDVDANRLADVLIEGVTSLNPSEVAPMVKATIGDPIRKTIMEANGAGVKSIVVEIDTDGEIDVNSVSSNLAMRKRRVISATATLDKSRLVLNVTQGDYVLLPAVRDGIIKIEPPQAGDSFDKIVGLDSAIKYARRWISYFEGKNTIRPLGGMILCGPPGTGKTSFVRCLAGEIKCPYAVLNCSELSSAEAITSAFGAFRRYGRDGLIVFLDELDAVAGDRDEDKTPAYVERLNLLLEQIDGFNNDPQSKILYCGATNRFNALDAAIMRDGRLGHVIHFRGLDAEGRRKLLTMEMTECALSPMPDAKLLEFMVRTTEDMSGAMLKAIVRELAMTVAESGRLTREVYAKVRRIVVSGESTTSTKLDKDQLMSVAIHEASHAFVCDVVGRDFIQCSIVEDGSSRLGYVESSDKTCCTSASILESIDISLAGRAGQEIMGLSPSGAESDLRNATRLAFSYIQNGFSSECGLLYLEEADEQMKAAARKLLDERYKKVGELLRNSRSILSRFAKMLVERRTLFHDDLRMLKKTLLKKGSEYGN